jgi:GNAT superfamily N-acetyltransferase
MVTAQPEDLVRAWPELEALFPEHWAALGRDKLEVPLKPHKEAFFKRALAGEILCVTLRKNGSVIGYFVGIVGRGLHYSETLQMHLDLFWVRESERGQWGGVKLLRKALAEADRRGVRRVFLAHKVHYPEAGRLFKLFGFEPVEIHYSKVLGDEDGRRGRD